MSSLLWHVGPNPADTWNNTGSKISSIGAGFDSMQKAGGSVSCSLLLSSQASLSALCPCGRHCASSHSNTYQRRSRELCLRTGEAASSRPGEKKGVNSDPPLEWVSCTSCTRALTDTFGTESIRTCRMELRKKHRLLLIFIFYNYFREITHMNKTVRNAPPSTQLFCSCKSMFFH